MTPDATHDRSLATLGRLLLSSAALDQALVILLADILGSGRAQHVFACQPASHVVPVLRKLATEVLPPALLQRLITTLEDVGQLHEQYHLLVQAYLTAPGIQAHFALYGPPPMSAARIARGTLQCHDSSPAIEDLEGLTVGFQSSYEALLALHADWVAFELASDGK